MTMMKAADTEIAGYEFSRPSLLAEALTHPSLSGRENYQRLEFLGDRVVGLVIAEWLLEVFPSEPEGRLNRRLASLVRRETLADMADKTGFTERLKLTPGAEQEGARAKPAVRADVFEAVIGAMYLDGGFEPVRSFIRSHFVSLMQGGPDVSKDPKTRLQEYAQKRGLALPSYTVIERSGPDHDPCFTVEAALDQQGKEAAKGNSRKSAEQAAALALLDQIGSKEA